ncbi:hypothetical protein CBF27_01740 [Vagococcus acidifermentans]|uniref:Transposase n=1 Tax=Vagococcus acidifermentans TaxID=564710 RepID=A0A430B323_9ENTE|nr:IS66 family insertion sequence element accessory protein TnpB [Vagococcus acidifermentans]RSU14723.1 hypothetical protein CBF27_01740 [Vagococcus acidifermentans]
MLLDLTAVKQVYIVTGFCDLRKGIDGLAGIVQQDYQMDVYDERSFCFAADEATGSNYCTGMVTAGCSRLV